jgi:hypothetical protein
VLSRTLRLLAVLGALGAVSGSAALAAGASDFPSPRAGAVLTAGSLADARWRAPEGETLAADVDEAELVLSLDGGNTFPVRVSAELAPGSSSYRWRVPALPTGSARLALRVGAAHTRGRERILRISELFAIAAEAPEPEALSSGPEERWTGQALLEHTPGDLLGGAMREAGERLVAPAGGDEADDPDPAPALAGAAARRAAAGLSHEPPSPAPRRVSRSASGFLPLRL